MRPSACKRPDNDERTLKDNFFGLMDDAPNHLEGIECEDVKDVPNVDPKVDPEPPDRRSGPSSFQFIYLQSTIDIAGEILKNVYSKLTDDLTSEHE
jgi:hypothetical protein